MQISGKHFVITGAANGVGRATAELAVRQGAQVTSLDVEEAQLDGVRHIHCDVRNELHWAGAVDSVAPPEHLFLNAGVMSAANGSPTGAYDFDRVDVTAYRRLVGVNIDGVVFGLMSFLPRMAAGSSIVVTASLAGLYPYAHDPLYCMTKHAVVGLVRAIAPSLAERDIRINAICPNRIDTSLLPVEMRDRDRLRPESVGRAVLQLCDEDSTGGAWAQDSDLKPIYRVHHAGGQVRWLARVKRLLRRLGSR